MTTCDVDQEVVDRLMTIANPRDRAMVALMAYSGVSTGELLGLLRSDLHRGSPTRLEIRNGKLGRVRDIEVDNKSLVALDAHLANTPQFSDEAPIFPGEQGGFLSGRAVQHILRRLSSRIDMDIEPRQLRWFFISQNLGTMGTDGLLDHLGVFRLTLVRRPTDAEDHDPGRRPAGRPRKGDRDAELWQMVRNDGKSYRLAAMEYGQRHGVRLSSDAVRMAVSRYEGRGLETKELRRRSGSQS